VPISDGSSVTDVCRYGDGQAIQQAQGIWQTLVLKDSNNRTKTMSSAIPVLMPTDLTIREFEPADWPFVWALLEPIVRGGESYVFARDISEDEMHQLWIKLPSTTFVACDAKGDILGTYFIKPNQPGLGAHVSNCGYATAAQAQGRGVASCMCEHSQKTALAMGFKAMQFNFVVSSNEGAVRLWKKHGFNVVGRVPQAFQHHSLGLVDVLVMHKFLT
jgi:ribosomal protein S18 acetylase RimI-like enzyme